VSSAISFQRVGKRFDAVQALDDVSFDVAPGEIHALMGENGAGKSTLMKILSGVVTDYEGHIILRGEAARFRNTAAAEHAGISIIHQELNVVDDLSVAANIFLGREPRRWGMLDVAEMNRGAQVVLDRLQARFSPTARVSSLRIGDRQLVEISKALSRNASIVIMDEPTSALTEAESARLYDVIAALKAAGVTIIYISHKMDEVFRLADRITVLRDGKVVRTAERLATTPREVAHAMVGREIAVGAHRQSSAGDVVLRVDRLTLPWPGHPRGYRLKDVSLEVRRGEVLGIAGLMGAGRTELLECLFGASPVRFSGTVELHGRRLTLKHPRDAIRSGIALVTEDRKGLGLFDQFSVQENITIASLSDVATGGVVSRSAEHDAAHTSIRDLRIRAAGADAAITSLSGGNQQKCILGRCLLQRPQLLLLDDPTRGVDIGAKVEIYRLMHELADQGLAMIVTSSELPELLTLADRIVVLREGVLTGEFSREEATEQRIMEAATSAAG
jgi:ribose transport system ATP-binding protein